MLKYVENKNIDKQKWDAFIRKSSNGFVYSLSDYLNVACNNWDALIYNDYEIIMPLPFKKKIGIKYIIQPLFSQQLGIIYNEKPTQEIINKFILFLKHSFLYFAVNLNYDNTVTANINNIEKTNLILNLNNDYEVLKKGFSKNTKRNINKSDKENLTIEINKEESGKFISFFESNLKTPQPSSVINSLKNIIDYALLHKIGEIHTVKKDNQALSSVFFLKSFNRYIYLAATSNNEGKKNKAMFYLVNSFINTNSNSQMLLDFEGSDVEGVQRFYNGFGATSQNYYHIYKKIF